MIGPRRKSGPKPTEAGLARREEARELRRRGLSIRQIVAMTGHSSSVVGKWTADIELTPEQHAALEARWGVRFQPRVDPRAAEAARLRAKGASIGEIVKAVGAAKSAVSRWVKHVRVKPAARRAIEARRVEKQREVKEARAEEVGRRRMPDRIPPALPEDVASAIRQVLGEERHVRRGRTERRKASRLTSSRRTEAWHASDSLERDEALRLIRLTIRHNLVAVGHDFMENCDWLFVYNTRGAIEARARGMPYKRNVEHIPHHALIEPPRSEAEREFAKLAYAAGRQTEEFAAKNLAVRAVNVLNRHGMTLIGRDHAVFCRRVREGLRAQLEHRRRRR